MDNVEPEGQHYPTLSIAERDRRWGWTKEFLAERGMDALIMFGLKGRERFDGYLSNEWTDGVVLFQVDGEPVVLTWTPTRIIRRKQRPDETPWIADMRVGPYGMRIPEFLAERDLMTANIAIVGLESRGPAEWDGIVPYKLWTTIRGAVPDATFTDLSIDYGAHMLVKSEEEIALARNACRIGELACQAMIDATEVGASEYDIYADIMHVIHSNGAFSTAPHLILNMGPNDLGWGHPMWTYSGGAPRCVQSGDMVQAEIFPCYGGIESQMQMAIGMGDIKDTHLELAELARASYEAAISIIKPGVTLSELSEAMTKPILDAGCWHLTPVNHSVGPICWSSKSGVGIEQMPGMEGYRGIGERPLWGAELEFKEGMLWELEPNACRTDHRVNIGGTVLVTKDGVEELNDIPTRMYRKN